jgi:hypothetical protein
LNTGFVNGSAYANYTKGKNDFGLEYSINLRNYNDRRVNSIYDYKLGGKHYRSDENRKDHFGYTYQNIVLRIPGRFLTSMLSDKTEYGYFQQILKRRESVFSEDASGEDIRCLKITVQIMLFLNWIFIIRKKSVKKMS